MTEKQDKWATEISHVEPNKVIIRGYRLAELVQKVSFTEAIYLVIKGELPDSATKRMLDAILVAAVDHGASPPSTLAARTVVSSGGQYNAALAAGILSINKFHGGAVEDCARIIKQLVEEKGKEDNELETAKKLVISYREKKKKIPGFGHRMHTADPRVTVLQSIAKETGFDREYLQMGLAIEEAIKEVLGKPLPMNVDGMMAALLCELDFPLELANMFFAIARVPGLISHIYEEDKKQRKMRKIDPVNYEYTGVAEREL